MSIYCPRCGSQRLSPEVRFCSRCGFLLESVESLVATGGLFQPPMTGDLPAPPSPRKKGIRFGAKFLFASVVTFPLLMGAAIASDGPGFLIITVLLFLFGVSRMLYAWMFEDDVPAAAAHQPLIAPPPNLAGSLPSYRAPVSFAPPRGATTGELQPPPSVTEHTTNLLDRDAATDWQARASTEGSRE